jgi:hypothetical protein
VLRAQSNRVKDLRGLIPQLLAALPVAFAWPGAPPQPSSVGVDVGVALSGVVILRGAGRWRLVCGRAALAAHFWLREAVVEERPDTVTALARGKAAPTRYLVPRRHR